MADVFVSYKREDGPRVAKLVDALRSVGLEVWWDHEIPVGAPWESTIEVALAEAKAVVVCWSAGAVASENVRAEARSALAGDRLVQVFLDSCAAPLFFGERQGIDLSEWQGSESDARIERIVAACKAAGRGERSETRPAPTAVRRRPRRAWFAAAVAMVLAAGFAAVYFTKLRPAVPSGPTTLAVLPFVALDPADANLVDAIWDDTRGVISRNPNLRVLGRTAVESLAGQHLAPQDYLRKVGASYLLDGRVQHQGDIVEIKVSLVRANDGTEIWGDSLRGKLDDVFAFQSRIAAEIEGRLRGRLAPNRGIRSENIATSGAVYQIYADARAALRARNGQAGRAIELLRKALSLDPSFAPAWADLGVATVFQGTVGRDPVAMQADAVSYVRRALTLAPNLSHAHAAMALVQGTAPETESDLRRAVALDPNDAEAWMWLGNCMSDQNRIGDALVAYHRATAIEPIFAPASGNLVRVLVDLGDDAGVAAEVRRVERTGDPVLLLKTRSAIARARYRLAEQVSILLKLRRDHPDQAGYVARRIRRPLLALGYVEQSVDPADVAAYRGKPGSPAEIRAAFGRPLDFWLDVDAPMVFGRLLPRHGRLDEYVGYFRAAFSSADAFVAAYHGRAESLITVLPNVAVILRTAGASDQGASLLQMGRPFLAQWLKNGPTTTEILLYSAEFDAADGRDDAALNELERAVAKGWLPDGSINASDLADEPCFEQLRGRPEFEAIRGRVLAKLEQERQTLASVPVGELAAASGLGGGTH